MKRIICLAFIMSFAIFGYAQKIKLAGTTWIEDVYEKTWTFNQNGTITKKQTGTLSGRLGGVYCTVEIVQTRIGTKWKQNGDTLRCEDIPLQISVKVNLQNAYSYAAAQKQRINAAIPALKQQVINGERQKWQSKVGEKYIYVIRRYSPKEFWLQYGGYSYNETWLHRDIEHMTAAQKAAYDKLVAEFEAEKAKREAEEKARREAEEKAEREADEMDIKNSIVDGYVNLGLPSGTLWAACNVGATNPEDYGDYFAWGETKGYNAGKTSFDRSTYKWCKDGDDYAITKYCTEKRYNHDGITDNKTELEPEDDAAYVNCGPEWRMPRELFNDNYTTTKGTKLNGVYGFKITSKTNGNSIFLPAAGYRHAGSFFHENEGFYWSRTLYYLPHCAWRMKIYNTGMEFEDSGRSWGGSVRPVRLSE